MLLERFFMFLIFMIAAMSLYSSDIFSFGIKPEPICTVFTPNSILQQKENYSPLFVGNKKRYATCTGATWFHEDCLAVLNLYGRKIITYKFNDKEKNFDILQEINNNDGAQLVNPENLSVSPDGTLLAVCFDSPHPGLKIYTIDLTTHLINPTPIFSLPAHGLIHNVRFSPDGTCLALVGWDTTKSLCIYKIINKVGNFNLELVHSVKNDSPVLKPKGINFTADSKFVVVCYAPGLDADINQKNQQSESLLISYEFNNSTKSLGKTISIIKTNSSTEDIAFLNNDNAVILSDQGQDRLLIYPFDPQTGSISDNRTLIQNPEGQLNFPHGLGISNNGNYLVVTNYGDDKFNLYQTE